MKDKMLLIVGVLAIIVGGLGLLFLSVMSDSSYLASSTSQLEQSNPGYGPGMMGRGMMGNGGMMGANLVAQPTPDVPSGANSSASSSASSSSAASGSSSTSSSGAPSRGRGMMGSGPAGGLIAVDSNGKPVVSSVGSDLPANTATQQVRDLNVTIALSPYPPVSFQNGTFLVTLVDDKGQAMTDAQVSLDLTMPSMWMPASKPTAQNMGNGKYQASAMWTMRGGWRIEVIVTRGSDKYSAFFDVGL